MFDDVLTQVERALDIPYPQRTQVVRELEFDLWALYEALREQGFSDAEARAQALHELDLDEANLASLTDLHTPTIRRIVLRLPKPAREPAEWLAAGLSLFAGVFFIISEVPMLDFMREGGFAMWVILLIGGLGALLHLRRILSWFVIRDHSPQSLARNTPTPLYLALTCFIVGVAGTSLGFIAVLNAYAKYDYNHELLVAGSIEALAPVVFGGAFAVLLLLVHTAITAAIRGLQIKQPV